jgi:hypothetical protein
MHPSRLECVPHIPNPTEVGRSQLSQPAWAKLVESVYFQSHLEGFMRSWRLQSHLRPHLSVLHISITMSVTTTANPATYTLRATLADYDLHHSNDNHSEPLDTSLNAHPFPPASNPSTWPIDARRVPPYRPVNTELDQSTRAVYQNGIERAFVSVMFTGVFLEAVGTV